MGINNGKAVRDKRGRETKEDGFIFPTTHISKKPSHQPNPGKNDLTYDDVVATLPHLDKVIGVVAGQLPQSFPGEVSEAIFEGMRNARDRLIRSRTA